MLSWKCLVFWIIIGPDNCLAPLEQIMDLVFIFRV